MLHSFYEFLTDKTSSVPELVRKAPLKDRRDRFVKIMFDARVTAKVIEFCKRSGFTVHAYLNGCGVAALQLAASGKLKTPFKLDIAHPVNMRRFLGLNDSQAGCYPAAVDGTVNLLPEADVLAYARAVHAELHSNDFLQRKSFEYYADLRSVDHLLMLLPALMREPERVMIYHLVMSNLQVWKQENLDKGKECRLVESWTMQGQRIAGGWIACFVATVNGQLCISAEFTEPSVDEAFVNAWVSKFQELVTANAADAKN